MLTVILAVGGFLLLIVGFLASWLYLVQENLTKAHSKIDQLSATQQAQNKARERLKEALKKEEVITNEADEKINTRTYFE